MDLKVLLVEDHTLVSEGLSVMLSFSEGMELIGVVSSAEEAVETVRSQRADVVLMDVKLRGDTSGLEATRLVKEISPTTKVIILTMFTDPATVGEAVKVGADGYLSKGISREELVRGINDVFEGRSVLDPNVTRAVFERISGRDQKALSDRELEVLQELAHGKSTREVAEGMFLSEETVKTYLKQIFRKLDVHDRTEAVAEAFRRGLVH